MRWSMARRGIFYSWKKAFFLLLPSEWPRSVGWGCLGCQDDVNTHFNKPRREGKEGRKTESVTTYLISLTLSFHPRFSLSHSPECTQSSNIHSTSAAMTQKPPTLSQPTDQRTMRRWEKGGRKEVKKEKEGNKRRRRSYSLNAPFPFLAKVIVAPLP